MQHVATIRAKPFTSPAEYMIAEMDRLDALLGAYVSIARQMRPAEEPYQGLFLSEPAMDALLMEPADLPRWTFGLSRDARDALRRRADVIAERRSVTYVRGDTIRFCELEQLFALSPRDVDILLVATAPEFNVKFERQFAYLQDDVTKRRPSVDLALNLVSGTYANKIADLALFEPCAPLLRHGLIELVEDPASPDPPLLGRYLKLDPRILGFMLGSDTVDDRIRYCARVVEPGETSRGYLKTDALDTFLQRATTFYQNDGRLLLHMHGRAGAGKRAWAEALCQRNQLKLLTVDAEKMVANHDRFAHSLRLIPREATLANAMIFVTGFDALLTEAQNSNRERLLEALGAHGGIAIVAGTRPPIADSSLDRRGVLSIAIEEPTAADRLRIWSDALGREAAPHAAALPALAAQFRFTPGDIAAAAAAARAKARWRDPANPRVTESELYAACRESAEPALGELARKVSSRRSWDDLVLPEDTTRQLREICDRVRHRGEVLEQWGFARKLAQGIGLSVLFSGASGTGKTLAAEIMASELGLHLYKIDLSMIVSKYIGETEKNLSRVFTAAECSSAILFFDEADALFGKRSEVRDSHDRYANVETSYLLQRMDEYEGISILATNLRRNMDEAFSRRLAFLVHFPVPEPNERLRIWHRVFPPETPISETVDLEFMANQFKLSGGNIRNIALAAAFYAATSRTSVAMPHLIRATRRELQKLGKNVTTEEFGIYRHLLE